MTVETESYLSPSSKIIPSRGDRPISKAMHIQQVTFRFYMKKQNKMIAKKVLHRKSKNVLHILDDK